MVSTRSENFSVPASADGSTTMKDWPMRGRLPCSEKNESASLTGAAIGAEADSFFSEQGNRPRIGQSFIVIDPSALAGTEKFSERVETIVAAMLADPGVRLPGARRFACEKTARSRGIEVPEELLAQIEKLCSMQS
jgi:LDH2 family malate/lactate/ureidoglycolate dehydrogenase